MHRAEASEDLTSWWHWGESKMASGRVGGVTLKLSTLGGIFSIILWELWPCLPPAPRSPPPALALAMPGHLCAAVFTLPRDLESEEMGGGRLPCSPPGWTGWPWVLRQWAQGGARC